MRVLAAMSGGVDSAVAAARAVEAGHEVTGVHLALSQEPPVLPSPEPVAAAPRRTPTTPGGRLTCSASRSTSGISATSSPPTWSTTSSPSTRPAAPRTRVCAATRRSSSPRCCNVASRWVSTPSAPVTTPGWSTDRRDRDAPRRRRRQGPVVRARRADPGPAAGTRCSRWATRSRATSGPRPTGGDSRWQTSRTATTSASSPTVTPPGSWTGTSVRVRAPSPTRRRDHRQPRRYAPLHRRSAQGPADRYTGGGRPAAVRARHLPGRPTPSPSVRGSPCWCSEIAGDPTRPGPTDRSTGRGVARCRCAPTESRCPPRSRTPDDEVVARLDEPDRRGRRRARRWSATAARRWSAARRSPRPAHDHAPTASVVHRHRLLARRRHGRRPQDRVRRVPRSAVPAGAAGARPVRRADRPWDGAADRARRGPQSAGWRLDRHLVP